MTRPAEPTAARLRIKSFWGRLVVFDGEGHGQQELHLGEPADRLWGFEDLHPGNRAVEAAGPGQHLAPPQSPSAIASRTVSAME